MTKIYLALGSNLGNRVQNLYLAIEKIRKEIHCEEDSKFDISSFIKSAPKDCPSGSPDFMNTVISCYTNLTPFELLNKTQAIEKAMGREDISKREINAPRAIDIDILLYGDQTINSPKPNLIIPHPRMKERDFVMEPLKEICSDFESLKI